VSQPPISLPLAQITADVRNQPRTDGLDRTYIEQLATVFELLPAVSVIALSNGSYFLVDGFHRFEAAKSVGVADIWATVIETPDDGDFVSLAFQLNAKHGRPLSIADRRAHAEHQLLKDATQADRSIARRVGLAAATVTQIRQALEQRAEIAPTEERIGSDGRRYHVQPEQRSGEPPDAGNGAVIPDGRAEALGPKERRDMRRTARYFQRLSVVLDGQYDLPWNTYECAATACVEILGAEEARKVASGLDPMLHNVLHVTDLIINLSKKVDELK